MTDGLAQLTGIAKGPRGSCYRTLRRLPRLRFNKALVNGGKVSANAVHHRGDASWPQFEGPSTSSMQKE
jgi:hypothetical protein